MVMVWPSLRRDRGKPDDGLWVTKGFGCAAVGMVLRGRSNGEVPVAFVAPTGFEEVFWPAGRGSVVGQQRHVRRCDRVHRGLPERRLVSYGAVEFDVTQIERTVSAAMPCSLVVASRLGLAV